MRVRICVLAVNEPAIAFWPSLGYARLDDVEKDFPAGRRWVVRMELRLAA